MFLWHPLPSYAWWLEAPWTEVVLKVGSFRGWLLVLLSTFLISHAELFGLRQVIAAARQRIAPNPKMVTSLVYRLVRHPLYLGFLIDFCCTPSMT